MPYFLIFSLAFVISLVTTPFAQWVARRWHIVAVPGGRRQHDGLVPTLGGIPLMAALLVTAVVIYQVLPPPTNPNDTRLLRGIFWGSVVVFIGAIVDDKWELPPLTSL